MSVEIMTPQEIINAIQSGTPLIAPRCGGKRLTLSIVNQLGHLIRLEEEYKKLMEWMKMRLTDPEVAANLRENAEALQKVGIDPEISTLRYIKLSAYEDKEPNQKIARKEDKN